VHTRTLTLLAQNPLWVGIDAGLEARVEVPVRKASGDLLGDIDLLAQHRPVW
jgi:hypothetical protein